MFLFSLFSLLTVAAFGYFSYRDSKAALEQATFNRLADVTALKEAELNSWLGSNQRSLRLLAQRPQVKDFAAEMLTIDIGSSEYEALRDDFRETHFHPIVNEDCCFAQLFLIRVTDGQVMASTDRSAERTFAESAPFFIQGQEGDYITAPAYDLRAQAVVMHASTPVFDAQGQLVAVLVAHIDLIEMRTIVSQRSDLYATKDSYLVNRFNFFVTESRFIPDAAFNQTARSEGVTRCLSGESGIGAYNDYRDVRVMGAFQWIENLGLCLVSEIDEAEALEPVRDLRQTAFGIGLIVLLVAGVASWLLSLTITRPISRLTALTQDVAGGNLDVRIEATGRDEIGQLSRAFSQMTASLKETTVTRDDLAIEVAQRKRVEDILVQQADELTHSNSELQQFAYVASHDLQEPLRMVSSYLQLIEQRYTAQLDDDAHEFIAFAVDGANRMKILINDLLMYSRVGTRGEPFGPVDGESVLEKSLNNLQISIEESSARITHDPLPTVDGDEGQLIQLFQNLIGNGIKFKNDNPPEIHIGAEQQDGVWQFCIRDNGIGMEPEYFERIFVIFQRLHGKGTYPGTGIGLAVCKKIVQRHGGQIWVESSVGTGSTFYFTIKTKEEGKT
jgi:signal transduction histidine kinase